MKDLDKWKSFLTDQFGEENEPKEYRTLAGRTLSVDDGTKNEFDVEFSEDGSFQRVISYRSEKRGIKH